MISINELIQKTMMKVTCQRCGSVIINPHTLVKYCPPCRKIIKIARDRKHGLRRYNRLKNDPTYKAYNIEKARQWREKRREISQKQVSEALHNSRKLAKCHARQSS